MEQLIEQLLEILREMSHEVAVRCKYCGSYHVVKNGSYRGTQRYLCRSCGRGFTNPNTLPKAQFSISVMGSAVDGYYSGMSLKETGRHIEQDFGVTPSHDSIYTWLERYIPIAQAQASKHIPKVSDKWLADETVLKIGGDNYWLHTCLDSETRFLLATHLSHTRTIRDARTLMEKASRRAGNHAPKVIMTDGLKSYIEGIELTFGADTKHIVSSPFDSEESTNLVERWHGTLKDRFKTVRGLQSPDTAKLWLAGFQIDYNFYRPHESLGGKTPAEKAGIRFPFRSWTDVVRSQAYPTRSQEQPIQQTLPHRQTVLNSHHTQPVRKTHARVRRRKLKRMQSSPTPILGTIASWQR